MTIIEKTRAALEAISSAAGGPLAVEHDGRRFTCELTSLDTMACAFEHFSLTADALADAPIERLRETADALARRLSYLLEPISTVEVDSEHCVVQMRSNPPQKEADQTSYYELLVRRGGELSLQRFVKERGAVRRATPATVTREVFLRLVGDFASVAE